MAAKSSARDSWTRSFSLLRGGLFVGSHPIQQSCALGEAAAGADTEAVGDVEKITHPRALVTSFADDQLDDLYGGGHHRDAVIVSHLRQEGRGQMACLGCPGAVAVQVVPTGP